MKKAILLLLVAGMVWVAMACSNRPGVSPEAGQNLALQKGCAACHSVDETDKIGPSWVGLYGSQVELADGTFVTADEDYLIESIKEPNARIVKGFSKGSMPPVPLSDEEVNSLVAYIKGVK